MGGGGPPLRTARMRMLNTFGISFTNQAAAPSADAAAAAVPDSAHHRSRYPAHTAGGPAAEASRAV